MAKTLSQMVTDVRQMIAQPEASNSNFSDDQITIWLNDAYRKICVEFRHLPIKQRDYTVSTSSPHVTLNAECMSINIARIQDPDASNKYRDLEVIDLERLKEKDPDYENATTGVPEYLIRLDVGTAILYPPPKSSVAALTTPLRTHGMELPTELSADGDTPNLPSNLHDLIPHWAAFRCFQNMADSVHATEQLTIFRGSLKDQKLASTEFSVQLNKMRFQDTL